MLQWIESDPKGHYGTHKNLALNVASADGSVRDIPLDEFKELLTNEGEEEVERP